ncbi:Acetyl esterase/lipase [Mycolicibacterium rutilum]|uniref:Acetyl esterase/lipase n=2 Tax=Mycolicibacterium rutilum TaxID=370526 RepID=A0A1H6IU48_MYCRU|nr:Acetyl esterase/lipase [Mycolicibacterium rutilum]
MVGPVLAVPLVAVPAVAVLGMYLPSVPYLGLATAFAPWYLGWLIVAAAAGGLLAAALWWRRRARWSALVAVTAVLAVAGASVIAARMTAAVEAAGARLDLPALLTLGSVRPVAPDAEEVYSSFDGKPLSLNIHRPPGGDRPAPVLVFVHGGGWVAGDRGAHSDDLRWFADRGWLTISVGYSLSSPSRHLWDVLHGQIACALTWVGDNAARYGGDAQRLSLTGDSAGGNLAINVAYLRAADRLRSSCGGAVPAVAAVSALYPAVDPAALYDNDYPVTGPRARAMAAAYTGGSPDQYPQRYRSIASATHISAAAPPTLIVLPESDHLVPPAETVTFVDQAHAVGVQTQLVTVPFADHVFDARPGSIGKQAYRQLTDRWLRAHGQAP